MGHEFAESQAGDLEDEGIKLDEGDDANDMSDDEQLFENESADKDAAQELANEDGDGERGQTSYEDFQDDFSDAV